MEQELIIQREEKINMLTNLLVQQEDGVNFIGNGEDIIHHEAVPLKHTFVDQIYVRQMDMKKDTLVVGAIHKDLHVWFLMTGNLTIATKEGVEDYIAPCYVVSQPGTQRVIYANEDSIFVNVHKNPENTTDIDELEKTLVATNRIKYEEHIKKQLT
tara:strand:- start:2070 stop:2537 length:468 start_codon:yes stop_codon:yes gene_type:complete